MGDKEMRKKVKIVLLVFMLFLFSGCGISGAFSPPPLPTQQMQEATQLPDPEIKEPEKEINEKELEQLEDFLSPAVPLGSQIIIKIDNTETVRELAPDGSEKLILSYLCEKPRVEIDGNDTASDRINGYLNDLDEEYYTGENHGLGNTLCPGYNKLLEKAIDNYQCSIDYNTSIKLEFEFSHFADVVRCDGSVISFLFSDSIDTVEEERATVKYAVSFYTETGEVIRLQEREDFNEIREIVEAYLPSGQSGTLSWETVSYVFNRYGMTLLFSEGDGEEITIPYSAFSALKDPLFRIEEKKGTGELSMADTETVEPELSIIDQVNVSNHGLTYYLIVHGTVYDCKILSVQYSNYDEMFYPTNVHWISNYLSDCRLQLSLVIPDGMPNTMIRYSCDGVVYEQLITQSGYDGKTYLMDRSINAVG